MILWVGIRLEQFGSGPRRGALLIVATSVVRFLSLSHCSSARVLVRPPGLRAHFIGVSLIVLELDWREAAALVLRTGTSGAARVVELRDLLLYERVPLVVRDDGLVYATATFAGLVPL